MPLARCVLRSAGRKRRRTAGTPGMVRYKRHESIALLTENIALDQPSWRTVGKRHDPERYIERHEEQNRNDYY